MLSGVVQPVNERSRLPLQPYHSVWLAHWKRTDCDAAGETVSLNVLGSQELDCMSKKDGSTMGLEASTRSAHRLGKIKNRTFELGDFINAGGKSVGKERMFSSIFKDGQGADDVQVLIPELAQNLELNSTVHNSIRIPWSGCHSLVEDNSDDPPKLTRTCSARKDSFFRLNPLPERFDVEVDKFDKGKSAVSVGTRRRSSDMRTQSDSYSDECFMERNPCGHSLIEMQKSSGIRLFPSQSISSEEYETTKSHNDCYSQLKLQKCVNSLGTMRICTHDDVSGRTLADFHRSSETNNDLLITEKIDTFMRVPNINGNMSGDHSVPFFVQNNQRVQLQSRSCLKYGEVKECVGDVKASMVTIRNELSPATDEMSMDSLMDNTSKKNLHSASNSTASAKTFNMVSTEVVPSREVGFRQRNSKLHGVNLKPGAASWSEKMCPRSQSLQNKKLVEQPKVKHKFPNPDSGNRWVKRLKLSSLNSSIQGRSKLFNGVPKSNTISSEPKVRKHHMSAETADDKGIALLLSHGWIRRWRRIKTSAEALCEPESPKMEVEKFNEMQTPSIAAMAMMAKALTCSQQCELQKKGSYTVWNTKTP